MIIDFHTHLGSVVNKNPDDLLRSMDKAQIDKSVIIAGEVVGLSNSELMNVIKGHPDRFLGALYGDYEEPRKSNFNEFELSHLLNHPNIVGIKFYSGYQHNFPYDEAIKYQLNLLELKNKVAIFHCGDTYSVCKNAKLKYAMPIHIDEVAVDNPDLKIVIAHLANPWFIDTAEVMYKNKNVYTDISGFVYGDFTERDQKNFCKVIQEMNLILDPTTSDRFLFGTDWPISNQDSYCNFINQSWFYERELNFKNVYKNNEKLLKEIIK